MDAVTPPADTRPVRRWFGPGALVTLAVFVGGRIALEPVRDAPHFDLRGMDAYGATENYMLRKIEQPVEVAFFGSSQSVWAVLPDDAAKELGEDPALVRNLSVEGGTPFDMWNLIRRNEEKFKKLRLAIVEVNPFVLKQGLDSDPRVETDVAQHGTLEERLMLRHRADRVKQVAEFILPIMSVRRSLESAFLDVLDPSPGLAIYPCPEQRTHPAVGWKVDGFHHVKKDRLSLDPVVAARRMVAAWKVSKLQDHSLREALAWFTRHNVRVIIHEPPVHPEVIRAMHADPALEEGHAAFETYLASLQPQPFAKSFTPDPAECGITAEHMADRTHVNELGARIYSHHLCHKVRLLLANAPGASSGAP